ncbi:hypothetical protein B0H13DRAFT_1852545 [Mycena leptocephala]|nr:hypothetical protein B0H13DRAFT_1852545 [Mycena leptocephala]
MLRPCKGANKNSGSSGETWGLCPVARMWGCTSVDGARVQEEATRASPELTRLFHADRTSDSAEEDENRVKEDCHVRLARKEKANAVITHAQPTGLAGSHPRTIQPPKRVPQKRTDTGVRLVAATGCRDLPNQTRPCRVPGDEHVIYFLIGRVPRERSYSTAVNDSLDAAHVALDLSINVVETAGLAVLAAAVAEVTTFIESAANSIANAIQQSFSAAISGIQSAISAANKVPGINIPIPSLSPPDLSSLQSLTLPTTFEDQLNNLNSQLPTLNELRQIEYNMYCPEHNFYFIHVNFTAKSGNL